MGHVTLPGSKPKIFPKVLKDNYLMYKLFYKNYESKKWQKFTGLDKCFGDLENPIELFKIWFSEAEKRD